MNKYKIVKLINLKDEYVKKNLKIGSLGIFVKKLENKKSDVLFFNNKVVNDYIICQVDLFDIEEMDYKLPKQIQFELTQKIEDLYKKNNSEFKNIDFNSMDFVELIVDKEEYNKKGVFKGSTGVIAYDKIINNKILVDFTVIDENGKFCGDEICIDINDIKKIKK